MLPILLPLLIVGAITIILIILVLIKLESPTESPKNTRERHIESREEKLRTIGKKEVEHQKLTEKRREAAEKRTSKCSHYFGYLKNRPKNSPFPDECLGCPRIVECLLKKEEPS